MSKKWPWLHEKNNGNGQTPFQVESSGIHIVTVMKKTRLEIKMLKTKDKSRLEKGDKTISV